MSLRPLTPVIALTLMLSASLPALASEAPAGKSRAEVLAELEAARKDGSLAKMSRESSYAPEFERPSTANRADVLAALEAARKDGTLAKMSREASYAPEFEPKGPGRSRAEVLAELKRAQEDGSMRCQTGNRSSC